MFIMAEMGGKQTSHGNLQTQTKPSIFYTDIANLLSLTQTDFIKHFESEYKQGKAYRYFSYEFVRENYINELNKETPVCILKCKIIPSQRRNSKPYDVWTIVQKNKPNEPGGYIYSAYWTCTPGVLGTCNMSQVRYFVSRML